MPRSNSLFAQALTGYAGMQLGETLGRVQTSLGTLDQNEKAAALAAVVGLAFLLLRGRTGLR